MRILEPWNRWYRQKGVYRARLTPIHYVVLHHTAGPENQTPEAIKRYHEEARGWPHIGYHYLVYRDGRVYKTLPNNAVPICVREFNPVSICVAAVGDFSAGVWPDDAPGWRALWELKQALAKAYPKALFVLHKNLVPTECPGRLTWELIQRKGGGGQ